MKKILFTLIICLFSCNICFSAQLKDTHESIIDKNKVYTIKALEYYDSNQYEKSLEYLNKAIELNPDYNNLIMLKISILESWGKREEAIKLAEETIKKIPDDKRLNEMLGGLSVLNNDYDKGIKYLQIAAKLNPQRAIIHSFLGRAYAGKYDFDKAIEEYSKAIKLDPNNTENYIARAKAYGDKSDWKHTLDDYQTLIKMQPDNYKFHYIASLYKSNLKDYQGALASIDKAIELSPKKEAFLYSQKSWIYLDLKDIDNAVKYVNMALDIDSKDQYTNEMLAFLAYQNEKYKLALKASNRALKYQECINPVSLELRAKIFYKLGKQKEAIETIDKVIQYVPYDKEYVKLKEKMLNKQEI